jgi:hypothetical protein
MPGAGCGGLLRRALLDHDIAWVELGAAQRLAQLGRAGAKLRGGGRTLRPHPHGGLLAGQRHQRMHRSGRLDIEREAGPPDPLGRLDGVGATVAGNLELRHRRALRRRERDFEMPAWRGDVDPRIRRVDAVGQ